MFISDTHEQHIKKLEEVFSTFEIQDKSSPTEVIIKSNQLDINKIKSYQGETIKKFEFRPEKWEQFIGQTMAKERAKIIDKQIKEGIKCHFLLSAIRGHGKSSYVKLFAKDLNAHFIERIGKQINLDNLIEIINEINESKKEFVIFFVDEMDSMDKKIIKILNPIIESFEISGKKIKPFIFVGATINKYILIKNNPDTLDRIPHHIEFTRYSIEEMIQILKQYKNHLYPNKNISNKELKLIASNSKFNPRTAIGILEMFIVQKNIFQVLKNCRIVKDGLTEIDIRILKNLAESSRPLGSNALALKSGLNQLQYEREYEPFLYEFNYINRVPSRIITTKGKEFLISLTKE
ncbi:MAG: Holliday junction DNA helicase RuvB C-terminal domain-containing protein [Candidatus Helarchaeota archaeon]